MERIARYAREMLIGRLLPFWQGLRDEEHGGYYGYMDFSLNVDKRAEKGCILNSRILWFFSEAAMVLEDKSLIPYARHAYDFLQEKCLDREMGGVYWSVTYDGQPLDDTKHTYNQAFAIYALSAYYRLTGEAEALALAEELFEIIEDRCTDEGGYLEAFTRDFKPASNEKLSENGVMAGRTMNTLLHVFEGYAGLYQAKKIPSVAAALRRILSIYAEKVYNPRLHRQEVFFDHDYNTLIDLTSYGHDIESSWLIDWGCGLLEDAALTERIAAINSDLADNVLRTAFNGSLANECERDVVDTNRIWWVQAEALLGFVNEWSKHPVRTDCRDAAASLWQYITEKLVDRRPGGEWFWRLDEDGRPDSGKPVVEPWKCPYHNGRMCMELIRRDPNVFV
ncbi:MAG: AGE family epimerase/isomerase [Oscillospiraceae bacterium]|nr:AGE family epimerase/isomerase [Oscillospiraceae bacterium]